MMIFINTWFCFYAAAKNESVSKAKKILFNSIAFIMMTGILISSAWSEVNTDKSVFEDFEKRTIKNRSLFTNEITFFAASIGKKADLGIKSDHWPCSIVLNRGINILTVFIPLDKIPNDTHIVEYFYSSKKPDISLEKEKIITLEKQDALKNWTQENGIKSEFSFYVSYKAVTGKVRNYYSFFAAYISPNDPPETTARLIAYIDREIFSNKSQRFTITNLNKMQDKMLSKRKNATQFQQCSQTHSKNVMSVVMDQKPSPGEKAVHFFKSILEKNTEKAIACLPEFKHSENFSYETKTWAVNTYIKLLDSNEKDNEISIKNKYIYEKVSGRLAVVVLEMKMESKKPKYEKYMLLCQEGQWKMTFDDNYWVASGRPEYTLSKDEQDELKMMFSEASTKIKKLLGRK